MAHPLPSCPATAAKEEGEETSQSISAELTFLCKLSYFVLHGNASLAAPFKVALHGEGIRRIAAIRINPVQTCMEREEEEEERE